MPVHGTDKLTYFRQKVGMECRCEPLNGAKAGLSGSSEFAEGQFCVAPVHDLELTCQYR